MLLFRLLAGFTDDAAGRSVTKYLKPNGSEEKRARKVLAQQLRDGRLLGLSRELLALAIDPSTASTFPGMRPTRRVRFESPARGKGSTWARDLVVVDYIRRSLRAAGGGKEDAAIAAAEKHFGIKRSRAHAIWKAHKDLVSGPSAK